MAHRGTAPLLARRVAAPIGEREVIPRVPLSFASVAPGSCAALVHAFTARCPGLPADLREASPPALRGQPRVQRVFVCFRSAPDGPRAPPPASRAGAGHPGAAPGAGTFELGSVSGPFGSTAGGSVPLAFGGAESSPIRVGASHPARSRRWRELAYPGWGASRSLSRCESSSVRVGGVRPAVPPCGRNAPIPVGRMR
ncbi:hypothetical protein SAMN02910314_00558 [Denitrobacterium detoxificans]|uniref:Uncharacterized protein n=1 Tax=Denitrobacterium detoxificans TaxID=79604 RepID=A0A1H8QNT8_9ACTN|nr:hypothetical protein SAMN02910314_00558 [Denitrobacterium detoxificans]